MFALVVEREPLQFAELPAALQTWVQAAGAFALVGLIVYGLTRFAQTHFGDVHGERLVTKPLNWGLAVLALGLYITYGISQWAALRLGGLAGSTAGLFQLCLLSAAICALVAALLPVFTNLPRLRLRRIGALAKLSFKESIRRRIVWVFLALMLVFLFPPHWFFSIKSEDQVKTYVRVVYWAMAPLLLVASGLLAAFSIPADLRHQTMHTIVTKPVERFEIVLGRIVGHTLLMTLVLAAMTAVSLVFVTRDMSEEAAAESYKARVPLFGALDISEAKSVGREWGYRKYISGGATNERAVWTYTSLPGTLAGRDSVRCEFTFDIFRTHKGIQGKGIYCTFSFENWRWDPQRRNDFAREREEGPANDPAFNNRLADKYGLFELQSLEVFDYHTLVIEVPGALFKNLHEWSAQSGRPPLAISVRCESPSQYLGVAKHDLYLLDDEKLFEVNFFKGAVGLWFRLLLVIVVAVTLSTYLSGVISFLTTMFLYLAGLLVDFIRSVAEGKSEGGGPLEALLRLGKNTALLTPLDDTPMTKLFLLLDYGFRFLLQGFLYLIPDVERFDLTNYVAQGFDISWTLLLVDNFLPLLGYLLPCVVLAFYLIRSREIAA